MNCEVWKDIPEYEDEYQISSLGNVRSLPRVMSYSNGGQRRYIGKILNPGLDSDGRLTVQLRKNGKGRSFRIYRLIMAAFVGPCPDNMEVAHRDGDKTNNSISNLIYCTRKENMHHKQLHNTQLRGEKQNGAILTEQAIKEIRARYVRRCKKNGGRALSKLYGVHATIISRVVSRTIWKHVE